MSDHQSGEFGTLAERLRARATERHEELAQRAERADAARARQVETALHVDATSLANARVTGLADRLSAAAEQGRFEYAVWDEHPTDSNVKVLRRAFQYVAEWLKRQGFGADLRDQDEMVPDYGRVRNLRLVARWDAADSGSSAPEVNRG